MWNSFAAVTYVLVAWVCCKKAFNHSILKEIRGKKRVGFFRIYGLVAKSSHKFCC
jgi:hypothetical protein